VAAGLFAGSVLLVHAQAFPQRTVTLVVPWPAGGASDFVSRVIAKGLSQRLQQPVIVENVVGGGGTLGAARVLSAAPDGHTLLLSSPLDAILAPLVTPAATYRAQDLRPIAVLGHTDVMVAVRNDLGVTSLAELAAALRAAGKRPLSLCSPGNGSLYHLVGVQLAARAGAQVLHVPYTGFNQCITDMSGGRVDMALLPVAGPFPGFVDRGSIKALAVLGDAPNRRLPAVPPARKTSGFEDVRVSVWAGVHARAGTPDAIAETLLREVQGVLADPDVRRQIEESGATVAPPQSLQAASAAYAAEIAAYEGWARAGGVAVR
jgi:tripartite-type tricarboxylate transporter receptor subunit TctC